MAEADEYVQISSSAFLNLLLHAFRFWSSKPTDKRQVVYGLLLGYIEGIYRTVKKVVPLSHDDKPDLVMDDDFLKIVGRINRRELESKSINEVIGWYRSSNNGIKFLARDIKNQMKFQGFNPNFISLILDPKIYLDPDESGFSIFRLAGDNFYNMMSDYHKIPWEIEAIEDISDIISYFQQYIKSYFLNKPLITEHNE